MSDNKNSEVARKLELLKLRFKEKATQDIALLEDVVDRFNSGRLRADDISTVYHSLHRLAGSAGTFGYGALGEEARSLENLIKPLAAMGEDQLNDTLVVERIRARLDQALIARVARLSQLLSLEAAAADRVQPVEARVAREQADDTEILIVDPDLDWARGLARNLESHGLSADVFSSLKAAIEHGLDKVSGLVVRDSLMLGEGHLLHSLPVRPPLISIGAEDSFDARYRLAERGVDGFLSEPLDIPVLADYLERLIMERAEGGAGRVMIVDDDPELLEHYGLVLEESGLEVRRVNNPAIILSVLSEFRPDIVLMDVQMGAHSGPNLARMLRYDPEWLGLPIIFLSSEEDREFQVDALAEGGDDFLTKPISDSLLLRAVTVRCYRARQLDKLVSRDSLTGLLKHSVIKSEVGKELARCQRLGQQSVVAMLDLDHFKQVNDCYGHRTGDLVIKGLANLLRHRLRKSDVIGRYGGEEFMVALPDCSVDQARVVFHSVCDLMSRISFTGGNKEFHVTLSVGIAPLEDYVSVDDAIEAADKALYSRKLSGRNGVTATSDESQSGKVGN